MDNKCEIKMYSESCYAIVLSYTQVKISPLFKTAGDAWVWAQQNEIDVEFPE